MHIWIPFSFFSFPQSFFLSSFFFAFFIPHHSLANLNGSSISLVVGGAEEATVFSNERDGDFCHAGEENGDDGDELENQCGLFISTQLHLRASTT